MSAVHTIRRRGYRVYMKRAEGGEVGQHGRRRSNKLLPEDALSARTRSVELTSRDRSRRCTVAP